VRGTMEKIIAKALIDIDQKDYSLSIVMPRAIRVAEHYEDFYNYLLFILVYEANKKPSEALISKVKLLAFKKGFPEHEFEDLKRKAFRWSIILKSIDSIYDPQTKKILTDQVVTHSIVELEEEIKSLKEKVNRTNSLEGLHTLDAYYVKQSEDITRTILENRLTAYNKVYAKIKSYVRNFLISIEDMLAKHQESPKEDKVMNKNVFIIHGHNEAKWRELHHIISTDFGLNPIILSEQDNRGSSTIIEKFERYASECSFVFALFTPDDTVTKDGKSILQARPNVIFELGWFYGKLGRDKVCLLLQESDGMSIHSDLDGVMQLRFNNNIDEIYRSIRKELKAARLIE
jgi:predicted nucleotide-binding protein